MLNLIIDQLKETAMYLEWDNGDDDWGYYSFCIGKAGGLAAAAGTVGVLAPLLCDDLSNVYELRPLTEVVLCYVGGVDDEDEDEEEYRKEYAAEFEVWHILDKLMERSADEDKVAAAVDAPEIGWAEYGAALNEAAKAREADDRAALCADDGVRVRLDVQRPGSEPPRIRDDPGRHRYGLRGQI